MFAVLKERIYLANNVHNYLQVLHVFHDAFGEECRRLLEEMCKCLKYLTNLHCPNWNLFL